MAASSFSLGAAVIKSEPVDNSLKSDKQTLLAVLQFLKKHNLKETESLLKQEGHVTDDDLKTEEDKKTEVSQALAAVYKSDDDPSLYEDLYRDLKTFIDSCLDVHKVELSTILYPVFVHMYLELVYNGHEWNAAEFYTKFWQDQEEHHHEDLARLSTVRKKEHMTGNQLLEDFKTSKFILRMSRDSYTHLKRYLQEKRLSPLLTVIQDHLFIDVFDGVPRTQQQIQATSGGLLGEVDKDANKAKVYYGLLKEPDLNILLDDEEEGGEGDEKPKAEANDSDGDENIGAHVNVEADAWRSEASDIIIREFQRQPGPRHTLGPNACPLDFFFLMFPLVLLDSLVEETNRYARQCMETTPNSSWYETTIEEMRAFLGIQIIFGIRQLPRLWCYWSQDRRFNDPWVSSIMPINRFKNISRYFQCRDTQHQPQRGENGFDPLFKVRNVITATQETFQKYFQAGRELSVDECMVAFKGRLSFKQYMPAKPTKWGVKIWTICDAKSGFCLGYDVYTGKSGRRDPRKPLGYEVVDSLCMPHYNVGHHIYVDRFFHSVDISAHLLTKDTYICGTIMTNRNGLPAELKRKLKTKGDLLQLQKGNLVATLYHDTRTVCLLSSNQIIGTAEDGRPHPLIDYNKFMGGVDKFDQQLSYYPVGRPGKKWWRYIIWHLLNASVYNAYICWSQSPHSYDIAKGYDHLNFRSDVADALINGYTSRKLSGRPATKQLSVAPESIKHHVLSKINGRARQCVLCSMESRKTPKGYPVETSWRCKFCDVSLCKRVCFGKYHEVGLGINGASK